jgi:hypothetical protein
LNFLFLPPKTKSLKISLLILVASIFWIMILLWRGSEHATLFTKWTDNVSNLSATWIFLHEGPKIYGHGIEKFTDGPANKLDYPEKWSLDLPTDVFFKDRWITTAPDYLAWPSASRPYPPGAMMIFAPFSVLAYYFNFGFLIPSYLLAFAFLIVAHFGFFRFLELVPNFIDPSSRSQSIAMFFFCTWLYLELVHWALQGQYQICMLWPLIESFIRIKQKKIISAILWFSIAFFIHLHSIMYGPLIALITLGAIYSSVKEKKIQSLTKFEGIQILLSAVLLLFSLHCLYRNLAPYTTGQLSNANPWFWKNLAAIQISQWIPLGVGVLLVSAIQIKSRNFIALITFSSICCIFLMSSNLGAWYSIAVIPLFLTSGFVPQTRLSFIGNLIGYVLITGTFLANSPFEFYFIRAYFSAPLG